MSGLNGSFAMKTILTKIPHEPGCYIYKDSKDNIIYVGKALDLRKRVSSYLNRNTDPKTKMLVSQIKDVDFIVTDNEKEALILENNLIKKHQPKYNINLKDAKRYAYIQVTDEKFARLLLARKRIDKGRFYGPFVSAAERDYVLELLRKIFSIRTCKRMPKKACLRHHIGLCHAPCIGKISTEEYDKKMKKVEMVLKGNTKELIFLLDSEMKEYSRKKMFENAARLRDQISALEHLSEKQAMERSRRYDEDIVSYIVREGKAYLMLFNVRQGVLLNKNEFVFDYMNDFFEDFLLQYYESNKDRKQVIIPYDISPGLEQFLLEKKIEIVIPKQGVKKKLLLLVDKNIESAFFGREDLLKDVQKKLKLEKANVIECFDVSHLSGSSTVGSMVQFRNGMPDKSNYRRFRIKTVSGIDDFSAIKEIVYRRYARLKKENKDMPDLVIIDGGKGQLKSALSALESAGVKIPVISIAKREEEIYFPGLSYPLRLKEKDKVLLFIRSVRDEAHRFAIKYQRMLQDKKSI